ncbi:hypothetical protein FJZ26_05440 [Candidatus Parvarchaeota archaeon]|nr:hypothetical protein [Candidatus Parvarchaeota archaeon]
MRKTFVKTLLELASKDKNTMVVTADLGYSVFEPFMEQYPNNYLNVGVAEANMIGVCAGLALAGKKPIAYSITPFIALRDLEQVRIDVCYHNLPIILVASGAGLCYGSLGPTHHGTEDIAAMRMMPNMTVTAPADPYELGELFTQGYRLNAPFYMRIGRSTEPSVHGEDSKPQIKLGKGVTVRDYGGAFALIACGNMVYTGLKALEALHEKGLGGKLISMHTIKPLDASLVQSLGEKMPVFTLEEHSIMGGLGSAVAECLADANIKPAAFRRFALADSFQKKVGTHEYLRKLNGLDVPTISDQIQKLVKGI